MRIQMEKVTLSSFAEFDAVRADSFGQPQRGAVRPGLTVELDRMWLARDETGTAVGCVGGLSTRVTLASGRDVPAVGVRWLGTRPEYRRRGVMRALLDELESDAVRRGDALALAWAIEPDAYRAMGYTASGSHISYTVRARRRQQRRSYRCRRISTADAIGTVPDLYRMWNLPHPGAITRKPDWWAHLLADPAQVFVLFDGDEPLAYAVCVSTSSDGDRDLHVNELVGAHTDATAELLEFLAQGVPDGSVRVHRRPMDDPLSHDTGALRVYDRHLTQGMHVRVLDPVLLFERLGRREGFLVIDTTDCLRSGEVETITAPPSGTRRGGCADMTIDRAELSGVVFGSGRLPGMSADAAPLPSAIEEAFKARERLWQSTWF